MSHHRPANRPRNTAIPASSVGARERPRLLFVSPVVPAVTGSGPAMRAAMTAGALARQYRVTLLVTPAANRPDLALPDDLQAACERVVRLDTGEIPVRAPSFSVVHVFQLAALPDAEPWLADAETCHIDLDFLASVSTRRLAVLAWAEGKEEAARWAEDAASRARLLEDGALSRFDRVYVSSEADRQELRKRNTGLAEIAVLPNSLPLPDITPFPPPQRGPYTILFTGTLSDAANVDAARYFSAAILPRIQAGADRPVTLRIVGANPDAAVQRLDGQAGVEVIGEVDDLDPWYRDAHLVVSPMRAGGGSRIAVLEAFAHQRPVVATAIGMEGIAVEDGRHAYIADEPIPFATAALRLLHDPALAEQMAAAAFDLFSKRYTEQPMIPLVSRL